MERVFVVERAAFFDGAWPHGFLPLAGADADAFLDRARDLGRYEPRPVAERTPTWKQWIPYCVLRCRSAAPAAEAGLPPATAPLGLFGVQRTSGQGEARLHGSWSIGLGGHVEPEDHVPGRTERGANFFLRALGRELAEELHLTGEVPAPRFCGVLNDDTTPVGTVHAGLVYVCDLVTDLEAVRRRVTVREISKMRGGFGSLVEFRELWQDPARFESWSQFLVQAGVAGPMGASNLPRPVPGRLTVDGQS